MAESAAGPPHDMPAAAGRGRPGLRFLLLLALCIGLFLWRGLFTAGYYDSAITLIGHFPWRSELPIPARADLNPLLTDQPTQFLVWRDFAARELREGRLPLWNPWAGAGRPLLANSQSAVFSPYNVGQYLLGERAGGLWSAAARLLVAGMGMWVLARRLGLSEAGAALAALSFGFSAPIVIGLGHPHGAGYTVLPWLLVATHALATVPGPGAAAGAAGAVALAFLTGHPETTFHLMVGTALWGAWLWWRVAPSRRRTVGWAVCGVGAGALLAAAHWVPFVEYLRQSHAWATRATPGGQVTEPLRAVALLAWLTPNLFGHPQGTGFWLARQDFQSISGYAGLAAPLLAAGAVTWKVRSPAVRGLAMVGLLCALIVYGCPPLPWLIHRLPLFQASMNQRLLIVVVAAVALLGGAGLDLLISRPPSRRLWIACCVTGSALLFAGVFSMLRPGGIPTLGPSLLRAGLVLGAGGAVLGAGAAPWGLVCLVALDLGTWGYRINPVTPPELHYPVTPFIAAVQAELAENPQRRLLARGYLFPAETPMRYGIHDLKGYDALEPARYARYLTIAMRTGRGTGTLPPAHRRLPLMATYQSPLLDAAGAAVIVSPQPLNAPGLALLTEAPGLFAYRNLRALPRARLARTVERLPAAEAVEERLATRGHDPNAVTLLEGPALPYAGAGAGGVEFLEDAPTRVRLRVVTDAPGWLVLADVMFPGWEASVDGTHTPIWTADLAFRAVPVPAGEHLVVFRYRPRSVRTGIGLSLAGAVIIGGLLAARRRRPKHGPSPPRAGQTPRAM